MSLKHVVLISVHVVNLLEDIDDAETLMTALHPAHEVKPIWLDLDNRQRPFNATEIDRAPTLPQ